MAEVPLRDVLSSHGVSRRDFLRYCSTLAVMMGLSETVAPTIARALERVRKPSVIWLSFQECTGCTESLTRAHAPSIETLILSRISLDYHHTLQAAAGTAAEAARKAAMAENKGKYLVVVDGSIPTGEAGFSTIAGISNRDMLAETVEHAAAVIAVGTCAAFGGLPAAEPNPTGAVPVAALVTDKPLVNVPGCPPLPLAITAVLVHYLTFGRLPDLDAKKRPLSFFAETIHDRCYRRPFYDRGLFAKSFDDEGAKAGWCLYELGCKGPTTKNACAVVKWNGGVSFPIQSGHPCLGCSEAGFWDGGGFYVAEAEPTTGANRLAEAGLAAGLLAATGAGLAIHRRKADAAHGLDPVTAEDLAHPKTPEKGGGHD